MKPFEIFFIVLLSIGAFQGIIYGIILWYNNGTNKVANRFLATILFFFSYRLIVEILKLFGIGFYDFFYHILLEYNWIYGALIYFFIKACVTPNFKLNIKNDWIHFLPVIIEFIWSNFIKSQNFYWDGTRESLSWLGYWGYVVWMLYPTQYIISVGLIIFYINKSNKLLIQSNSETFQLIIKNIRWIKLVLKFMKIYSVLVIFVVLIDFLFFEYAFNRSYHYPLFAGMALLTYWLGIQGFNKKDKVIIKTKTVLEPKEKELLSALAHKIEQIMINSKYYKNPDLSLSLLSKELGEKSYLITKCLNLVIGKKFNDYINEYRINELKELLKDPKNENYTLLSLAFEAGFNSKASFNRAVKKLTGKSPSALKSN
ncbi:helix-turn-helix domain-containing protein [Winogradskyella alexanderae]|uniref:Helix-turn-helix domain-containing protein n=1 Tax=Winogradskyella alexanderae TaxID=2877123 RepID=A0ABS7XR98_9FLAO|nr:helix-turn-helix domain-containing protein [Winogradskyella alexanderae]MCA0132538.1 helix-turn-helix domain-containing protein [Winogradskyella alexanderae]